MPLVEKILFTRILNSIHNSLYCSVFILRRPHSHWEWGCFTVTGLIGIYFHTLKHQCVCSTAWRSTPFHDLIQFIQWLFFMQPFSQFTTHPISSELKKEVIDYGEVLVDSSLSYVHDNAAITFIKIHDTCTSYIGKCTNQYSLTCITRQIKNEMNIYETWISKPGDIYQKDLMNEADVIECVEWYTHAGLRMIAWALLLSKIFIHALLIVWDIPWRSYWLGTKTESFPLYNHILRHDSGAKYIHKGRENVNKCKQ